MARKVTLFTGQWADLPFATVAERASEMGYDGLELSCWGDFIDVEKGAKSKAYCEDRLAKLNEYGLGCWAISNHLSGQLVCDELDERHNPFAPEKIRGDYKAMRKWAIDMQKKAAKTAANLGVGVVNGFTGSPIWKYLYSYPPCPPGLIDNGFKTVAKTWKPILDYYADLGVRFALEVHPTEIAYDIYTARRALEAIDYHPAFGFNFDPSHLVWQGVDPVKFLKAFPDRIYHCHIKDAAVTLDGESGILSSHLNFGDARRGWDFRSPGHGDVDFEAITRELNRIGYAGPLSIEWEDCGMDREYGAKDALQFTRSIDFGASGQQFSSSPQKGLFAIGIRDPESETPLATLYLADYSLVTSGTYERCFYAENVLYHHILDARTGRPVRNGLLSVSVVSSDSMTADALSTACFVLGEEKSKELLLRFSDVRVIFVNEEKQIRIIE